MADLETSHATLDHTGLTGVGGGGGSDLVQVASGAGSVIIPGLAGSPDIRVAGTNDDEFDTTDTSDPMTGWTTLGTPSAHDINSTVKSNYYIQGTLSDNNLHGIYKACPSIPFTVTAKLTAANTQINYQEAGLAIMEAAPGKIVFIGSLYNGGVAIDVEQWNTRTAYASNPVSLFRPTNQTGEIWFRIVVTLSTSIAYQYSFDGIFWKTALAGHNPGFTVGAVGLIVTNQNATYQLEAAWDWIRLT